MSRRGPGSRPRVQVRRSRYGRELLVDGTFASFWDPARVATGSVWDALAAPLLLLPPARRRSALVLGLGGGSVARLVRALAPGCRVVGVERDPDVLRAARDGMDLDRLGVEVVEDDARSFLGRDRRRYDLVVEDVFVGRGDAVRKPDWLPDPGHAAAARRLASGGVLVVNALDDAPDSARGLRALFPSLLAVDVEDFDNRILAAGTGLDARRLRARVAASPVLGETLPRLRFRTLQR